MIFVPSWAQSVYEEVSYLTGMSVSEVADMAFRIIMDECDPNRDIDGSVYRFGGTVDLEDVPEPTANCDIKLAWMVARKHAQKVVELLGSNPSLVTVMVCQENIERCCRFWSVRFPDPEWREKFAAELAAAEEDVERRTELMR